MSKEQELSSVMDELLRQTDPFLGTVADRDIPGKLGFSGFARHDVDERLYFDLGNNAVSASVSPRGAIRRAMIFAGVRECPVKNMPGVWHAYDYINFCEDESFAFRTGDEFVPISRIGLNQSTSLVLGAFPLTTVVIGDIVVRQLVMAPVLGGVRRVRGLLAVFSVTTERVEVKVRMRIPADLEARGNGGELRDGKAGFILLDGLESSRNDDEVAFTVRRGRPTSVAALLVMGENAGEFADTLNLMRPVKAGPLVAGTAKFFSRRLGGPLVTDGDVSGIGSVLRRSTHAQFAALLRDGAGTPVGSSWGSDTSERVTIIDNWAPDRIWMMDTFYNYLSTGLANPEMLLDGVKFFMFRSVPGRGTRSVWVKSKKLAKGDERPHSLGNAVAPVILAGMYYELTGDGETLAKMEETDGKGRKMPLRERIHRILDGLLKTRGEAEPMLIQSQCLSDGPARGKYHTGSNILAWRAFASAARLYREVFGNHRRAALYAEVAERMKEDIDKHCTVEHNGQRMFAEGAGAELVHDGEESGTTVAPFLGFCAADYPPLLAYKRFGASPDNPYWDAVARGVIWEGWGTTTPAFMSELAGARTEWELGEKLDRLRSLVDVDGQWWWWPHKPKKSELIRSFVGKCGWGTGVFLMRFLNTNLGITWDAPEGRLIVRPFVPWEEFGMTGLVYGSLCLDLEYHNSADAASLTVTHNQMRISELKLVLRAPPGAPRVTLTSSSPGGKLESGDDYFGKPAWTVSFENVSAKRVTARIAWR